MSMQWGQTQRPPVSWAPRALYTLSPEVGPFDATKTGAALVRNIAWNADSTLLATASFDKVVRVYRLGPDSMELVCELEGHKNEVKDVCFASSGELASCGRDKMVMIWTPLDGEAGEDGTCPVTDYDLGEVLDGHSQDVKRVSFQTGSTTLVSASYDNTIRVWGETVTDGESQGYGSKGHSKQSIAAGISTDTPLPMSHGHSILSCGWCPPDVTPRPGAESLLASGDAAGYIHVWGHSFAGLDHKAALDPSVHQGSSVTGLSWVRSKPTAIPLLVSVSGDNSMCVWRAASGMTLRQGLLYPHTRIPRVHAGEVNSLDTHVYSQQCIWAVTTGDDGRCNVWRLEL
ncbi:hypothetical protein KIPB_009948 [Kipferlia bialata]|uniref:Uncharacterized protein n=1 Tax=Kipferlia bialata TaxID=797122 RepID=A0A9K3D3Y0_9EUKA|nr:hypothetical protein KIPB_009948 [Kipferlia bialata]|eukprot:g9948.t1